MITIRGYQGRDFPHHLAVLDGEPPAPLSAERLAAITRIVLDLNVGTVDSDTVSDAFAWPVPVQYEGDDVQGLRIDLRASGLALGSHYGWIVAYDADHPHGFPWEPVTVWMMS